MKNDATQLSVGRGNVGLDFFFRGGGGEADNLTLRDNVQLFCMVHFVCCKVVLKVHQSN